MSLWPYLFVFSWDDTHKDVPSEPTVYNLSNLLSSQRIVLFVLIYGYGALFMSLWYILLVKLPSVVKYAEKLKQWQTYLPN